MDTLEEVKLILKELAQSQKETDRRFKETDRKFKETDRKFKDTDRKFKDTDRKFKETDRKFQDTDRKFQDTDRKFKETSTETRAEITELTHNTSTELQEIGRYIKELSRHINGVTDSNGLTAEQFFSAALERTPSLNGVSFDFAERNEKRYNKQRTLRDQYDVILYGEKAVGIVEIKYRLRSDDIEQLTKRKVENFRILFPEEASKDIYLAVAGLSVDDHALDIAKKLGVYVLTQAGEGIKILNDEARVYWG